MRTIEEYININESFKSSILRDIAANHKEVFKKSNSTQFLPHGIAWDQIEDDEIFDGESCDPAFIKKFVNSTDYIVLWWPVMGHVFKSNQRGDYMLKPGTLVITCGNKFVEYNSSKAHWEMSLQFKTTEMLIKKGSMESDAQFRIRRKKAEAERDPSNQIVDPSDKFNPSIQNSKGPISGHLTVNLLATNTYCECVAIPTEVIAMHSTRELMHQRFLAKLGSVADLRSDVTDQYSAKLNDPKTRISMWDSTYNRKMVDYPEIRKVNIDRYKRLKAGAKSIKLLDKYADKMKKYIETLDKCNNSFHVIPSEIHDLTGDKFIDIYFNNAGKSNTLLMNLSNYLQKDYNNILKGISNVIRLWGDGSADKSYIQRELDEIDKYVDEADDFVARLETNLKALGI